MRAAASAADGMTKATGLHPDTRAFAFEAGPAGVLLLHGLSSTPFEMRALGEALARAGYTAHAPLLPGHEHPRELARVTRRQWSAAVRQSLDGLIARGGPVVVVGQSLGALLGLQLARGRPGDVAAVCLLAPAFALTNPWPRRLRPVLRAACRLLPFGLTCVPKRASDIADPEARRRHPGLSCIPLSSVAELLDLQDETWNALESIEQPVLLLHGRHDHTASLDASIRAARRLPRLRRLVVLERSWHVVTVDRDRDRVLREVLAFVGRELGPGSGSRGG